MKLKITSSLYCLLLLVAFQSARADEATNAPPSAKIAVVFGDSLTQGNELPVNQLDHLWLKLVEQQAQGRIRLENEGKGGRTTSSLPEFDAMLVRHHAPDLLVIFLGMNDSRDVSGGCVPKAVANVRAMIQKGRTAWGDHLSVLIVGPTNVNKDALVKTKSIADQRQANLKALNDAFQKLAVETSSKFVSLFGLIPDATLLKDGVHPDGAGNEVIAKAMLPVLTAQLFPFDAAVPATSAAH